MPNQIEAKARKTLIGALIKKGIKVERSDNKTFDLIVRGKYAEIKGKNKCFEGLDFISLTKNQFKEAQREDFDIYLVCGVGEKEAQIYRINSGDLIKEKHRKITTFEYDKSKIGKITRKL